MQPKTSSRPRQRFETTAFVGLDQLRSSDPARRKHNLAGSTTQGRAMLPNVDVINCCGAGSPNRTALRLQRPGVPADLDKVRAFGDGQSGVQQRG